MQKYIISSLILFFLLTSCEDVIRLNLDESDTKLVIEARLDATDKFIAVAVSQSKSFYDTTDFQLILDAEVTLKIEEQPAISLPLGDEDLYFLENLDITTGQLVEVQVTHKDQSYQANAIVPSPIAIQAVEQVSTFTEDDTTFYALDVFWQDNPSEVNFYRLQSSTFSTLDDEEVSEYGTISDADDQGELLLGGTVEGLPGDEIELTLEHLNQGAFLYFEQLSIASEEGDLFTGGQSTPFNPQSNFSNDALGYFSVFQKAEVTRVLE
ncbi:MAG: DUF4249 family protein [Bacteroidota bacterium]